MRRNMVKILIVFLVALVAIPSVSGLGKTLWVDADRGNDRFGDGGETRPFKTITHALSVASAGDTIKVRAASRKYDEATGERFPISMKPKVAIIGVSRPTISGGSPYTLYDPLEGATTTRYVSVLGADSSLISGFMFLAKDGEGSPGTSILCNSTSPRIIDNIFRATGSAHAGIATLGTAQPQIQKNVFLGSLNWGITVYGESYPTITDNKFSTSNGIDCTSRSHPTIENNEISTNGAGISTKGQSSPTIRRNTISGNDGWGIMVRMDSTPAIQDNLITDNPVGIYIGEGNPIPDIGGGGRSHGNNTFNNSNWDIENHSRYNISARANHWSSPFCEDIYAKIYDKEEEARVGEVDTGICLPRTPGVSRRILE